MIKYLFAGIATVVLSACSLPTRAPVTPTSWLVAPQRTAAPLKQQSKYWLKIGSVNVASPFDGKSLVYRIGDQRYEKDFYNVYSSIPSEMIGNAEREWINKTNIFAVAVGQNNSFFPYYTLQATVNEFYGDYRVKPEAVVSVEFFLTVTNDGKTNPLLGSNRYTKRIALKDNTPEALVLGQQQALAEIFQQYEEQLYKYAGNLPKPLGQ
jgi:uncharacterized lipoprotein YmbA